MLFIAIIEMNEAFIAINEMNEANFISGFMACQFGSRNTSRK